MVREVLADRVDEIAIRLVEIVNPVALYEDGFGEVAYLHTSFRPLPKLKVEDFMTAERPVEVA